MSEGAEHYTKEPRYAVDSKRSIASHWHHKWFTPWHAVWRANEGKIVTVRMGLRGGCG